MNTKKLPVHFENTFLRAYAKLGERIGAALLDGLILVPLTVGILFFNSQQLHNYYYTFFIGQLVMAGYFIYLPVRYGATPGRRIMGLTILTLSGSAISYRESFIKYAPMLVMGLFAFLVQCLCISHADEAQFNDLSWLQQTTYLKTLSPVPLWMQMVVIYGYYIYTIYLVITDERNRSLSDQLAGTVVVHDRMLPQIKAFREEQEHGIGLGDAD